MGMLGIDLLGGAAYQSHAVSAGSQLKGFAVGMFWQQFGSTQNLINGLLGSGCSKFRIHLLWDTNHNYSNKARDAQKAFTNCLAKFAGRTHVELLISPYCEHYEAAPAMRSLIQSLYASVPQDKLAMYPKLKFVNTSAAKQWLSSFADAKTNRPISVLNEVHVPSTTDAKASSLPDKPPGDYTVSPDGWNLTKDGAPNYNKIYNSAYIRFAWSGLFNCHLDKGETPPTTKQIVDIANLLNLRG